MTIKSGNDLRPLIADIVAAQHRRGPDAERIERYSSERYDLLLGHNRLSIIDPIAASNQPMEDADGAAVLVFNGEIYNYIELRRELIEAGRTFKTQSDTEVLLEAYLYWGEAAFERFYGMFAFALFDRSKNVLYLVRDRFGVKPLYYFADAETLVFASTADRIARWANLAPDLEYVARGLRLKYYEDDSEISPFERVRALNPGHFLRVSLDDLRFEKHCYYDLGARVDALEPELARASSGELRERLTALLDDACRIRLRADVPVGISLSGGIDSSSVAALVSTASQSIVGFSYGRPTEQDSEGPLVAEVAAKTGIDMSYVWPEAEDELDALFWNALDAQRAPFPHSSIMAQFAVFERARATGVKVVLGGQGGDEAFMGYRKFFLFHLQDIVRRRQLSQLPQFISGAASLAPSILARANVFWSDRRRYSGGSAGMGSRISLPELRSSPSPAMLASQSLRRRQELDVIRFSLPSLLRYEDRNSMGNSVESRLPFLDHRIIEFGLALPVREKLHRGYGKYLLRQSMTGKIPDQIRLSRDKRGFDTRQEAWIRTGLGRTLRRALHADGSAVGQFLPTNMTIDALFSDDQLVGNAQAFKEAVSLIWLADPWGEQRANGLRSAA